MAHTITIEVDLLHKELCSGCPCKQSTCSLGYWDKGELVWYNTWTEEVLLDKDLNRAGVDGWGYSTKRPQKCIDELG